MGLLISFVFASAFAAFLVWLIISYAARRLHKIWGCAGGVITFFVVFAIFITNLQNIISAYTYSGFGVSVEEANKHLFAFKLPPQATEVNYFHSHFAGSHSADFKIDEKSFLAWATENGWKMERFVTEDRIANKETLPDLPEDASLYTVELFPKTVDIAAKSFTDSQSKETTEIHNGYFCSTYPPDSDVGKVIYYDIDTSRAYIYASNG